MRPELKAAWRQEMDLGRGRISAGDFAAALHHYERAHILGQRFTVAHVRAHMGMLGVGWRRRDAREIVGQLVRIVAATLFSKIWVPEGNTGGANVSAVEPMPIPQDLRNLLDGSG